jgi:hypothetical protein
VLEVQRDQEQVLLHPSLSLRHGSRSYMKRWPGVDRGARPIRHGYNREMACRTNRSRGRFLSLPSAVFALSFVLLGWIASHSITYALVGVLPHGHQDHHVHDYLNMLELAGGSGLGLAFCLALRSFFRYGSFGEWLHEGGIAGTRKQVTLATALPAAVFVIFEYLERIIAATGTSPSARLLVVGVLVQLVVGLFCLVIVRVTFRAAERVIHLIAPEELSVGSNRQVIGLVLQSLVLEASMRPMADSKAWRAPPVPVVLF